MAAGGHFGWPKITFDRISHHFRSIRNFYFFIFFRKLAAGGHFGRKSLSITSHFSPFQINTQIWFFSHKMAPSGHFVWPKITFDRISHHFRSISNFYFFHSLLIAFLAISDQYANLIFFVHKMSAGGHFRSICNFDLFLKFHKMAAGGHFGWPKITFECISRHFRSIFFQVYFFFNLFFFKMAAGGHFGSPIWPILDDRKSLSIAFLAISDQYTTLFF